MRYPYCALLKRNWKSHTGNAPYGAREFASSSKQRPKSVQIWGNSLAARKKGIPTLSFSAPPLTDFSLYEALPERLDWESDSSYSL